MDIKHNTAVLKNHLILMQKTEFIAEMIKLKNELINYEQEKKQRRKMLIIYNWGRLYFRNKWM